ncbi:MAG: hypothetical protein AAF335_01320 [Bacteroidota bacterium]
MKKSHLFLATLLTTAGVRINAAAPLSADKPEEASQDMYLLSPPSQEDIPNSNAILNDINPDAWSSSEDQEIGFGNRQETDRASESNKYEMDPLKVIHMFGIENDIKIPTSWGEWGNVIVSKRYFSIRVRYNGVVDIDYCVSSDRWWYSDYITIKVDFYKESDKRGFLGSITTKMITIPPRSSRIPMNSKLKLEDKSIIPEIVDFELTVKVETPEEK